MADSQVKQLGLALLMYASDWDEMLPSDHGLLVDALTPYTRNRDLFDRPGYPGQPVFRMLIPESLSLRRLTSPAEVPVGTFDYFHDGGYVVFADGHAVWVRREDMPAVLRRGAAMIRQQERR